jgi:hypothetical protein
MGSYSRQLRRIEPDFLRIGWDNDESKDEND